MTKERKRKDEVTAFDIAVSPDVRRLAEEVERTRTPASLKRGDKEIARVVPASAMSTQPPSDDLWSDYDPNKVKAAIKKHAGFLSKEEAETMIAEIHAAREAGSRPLHKF